MSEMVKCPNCGSTELHDMGTVEVRADENGVVLSENFLRVKCGACFKISDIPTYEYVEEEGSNG